MEVGSTIQQKTLKREEISADDYRDFADLRRNMEVFIDHDYSALGPRSPELKLDLVSCSGLEEGGSS